MGGGDAEKCVGCRVVKLHFMPSLTLVILCVRACLCACMCVYAYICGGERGVWRECSRAVVTLL